MKTTRPRSPRRLAALAAIAVLGVAACDSQPSAKRVAEDIIKTLAVDDPEVEACMLEVLDGYTKSELDAIGDGIDASNTVEQEESQAALDKATPHADSAAPAGPYKPGMSVASSSNTSRKRNARPSVGSPCTRAGASCRKSLRRP